MSDDDTLPLRFPYGQRYNPKTNRLDSPESKGIGFKGPLKQGDHIVSEYSSDRDIQYPSIYEGITPADIAAVMLAERIGRAPPRDVDQRAYEAAQRRVKQGRSPFFEQGKDEYPAWTPDQDWAAPAVMRNDGGAVDTALRLARQVGGGMPDETSQEEFLRRELEGSAKQYDPEAGARMAKKLALDAYGLTDIGGAQEALGYMPKPEGGFEKSALQHAKEGDYTTAGLLAMGAIVPGAGKLGKALKPIQHTISNQTMKKFVPDMQEYFKISLADEGNDWAKQIFNKPLSELSKQEFKQVEKAIVDSAVADSRHQGYKEHEIFTNPPAPKLTDENRLAVLHQLKSGNLGQLENWGAIPSPSISVTKPKDYFGYRGGTYGDVTLIGKKHLANPSEDLPIFAGDVHTPVVPEINEKGEIFSAAKNQLVPATLENVVEHMNALPTVTGMMHDPRFVDRNWEPHLYSLTTPQLSSLKDIKSRRGQINFGTKLTSNSFYHDINKLAEVVGDYPDSEKFLEAVKSRDFKKLYPRLSPDQERSANDIISRIENGPVRYFEGKPRRAVEFSEFAGSVMPHGTDPQILERLDRMGLKPTLYEGSPAETILKKFRSQTFADGGAVDTALRLARRMGGPLEDELTGFSYLPSETREYEHGVQHEYVPNPVQRLEDKLLSYGMRKPYEASPEDTLALRYLEQNLQGTTTPQDIPRPRADVTPKVPTATTPYQRTDTTPSFGAVSRRDVPRNWIDIPGEGETPSQSAFGHFSTQGSTAQRGVPDAIWRDVADTQKQGEIHANIVRRGLKRLADEEGVVAQDEEGVPYPPRRPSGFADGGAVDTALRLARQMGGGADDDMIERKEWSPFRGLKIRPPAEKLSDEPDIREYQQKRHAFEFEGAPEPEAPKRKVTLDAPMFGGEKEFGEVPYYYADPINKALSFAYGMKTAPLYSFGYTAPLGRAIDTYETAKRIEKHPTDVSSYLSLPKVFKGANPFGLAGVGAGVVAAESDEDKEEDKGMADGGVLNKALRLTRDKGRKGLSAENTVKEALRTPRPVPGSDAYWAERDAIERKPFSERMGPFDPDRYISPEEYRKGNLGRKEYVMSRGGRAHFATGGDADATAYNDILSDYVNSAYTNILGRAADQEGRDFWTRQLSEGNLDPSQMLQNFAQSAEFQNLYSRDPNKALSAVYQTALGRAPDTEGLSYWVNQAKSGSNLGDLAGSFLSTPEGLETQEASQLYREYAGRMPTASELQQAKEAFRNSADYDEFIQKAFPEQTVGTGTQVASTDPNAPKASVLDSVKDAASSVIKNISPELKSSLAGLLGRESGGTKDPFAAAAKTSSAKGLFQFIDSTWLSQFAKMFGEQIGLTPKEIQQWQGPFSRKRATPLQKEVLALRTDKSPAGVNLNMAMGIGFNQDNINKLAKVGLPPTPENIYSVHLTGGTRLAEAYAANPNSPISKGMDARQLASNRHYQGRSVGSVMGEFQKMFKPDSEQTSLGQSILNKFAEITGNVMFAPDQGKVQTAGATGTEGQTQTSQRAALTSQINAIYDKYLHQPPSEQGLNNLLDQLSSGKVTMADVDNFIKNSDAAKTAASYQNYRQQYDQWKAASDARNKFEADWVAELARQGLPLYLDPKGGPQVPPMPEWDNNKIPEMTEKYKAPAAPTNNQQGALDDYNKQVADWQASQQKYQSDYANWQNQVDAYKLMAAMNNWDSNIPAYLQASRPSAPGDMPQPSQDIAQVLAQQGAAAATGVGSMANPSGAPIGGAYSDPNAAWGNQATGTSFPTWQPQGMGTAPINQEFMNAAAGQAANAATHWDPVTMQYSTMTWDPTTGVGIHSPNYMGPGQYLGKIEGYGNYGPVYNSIGSYNPSAVTGYVSPTATNFTGSMAYGPPGMFKRGGVVKPDNEDIENALRLAKRKGGRINTKIDKDPDFDMSVSLATGGRSPAWTRKEGQNPEGGLNAKGRASAKAEGSNLKPPAPHPKSDAEAARRKSFCARMQGMKEKLTSSETKNDPNSRINKSLRVWNCHSDGGAVDNALRIAKGGEVWNKARPKDIGEPKSLSKGQKKSAKAMAKAAGRPYPNLVDNMRAAQRKK